MSRAMGSHQSHNAGTTTWLTPPHIIKALGPFDLDPCAAHGWVTAERHIILPEDGLEAEWSGRVWLNPPYGSEAWVWLSKLADHGNGTALIFARTETAGFVREVWRKADALMFLYGRLHFHRPDGTRAPANSGAPSVLIAYGPGDADRLEMCGLDGTFVRLAREAVRVSYCGRGICAALEGHDGTCAQASGWDDEHKPCLDAACDGGCGDIRRCTICGQHPASGCGYSCEHIETEAAS